VGGTLTRVPGREARRWRRRPHVAPALLVGAVAVVAAVMAYLMEHGSYDTWAAIPVALALGAVSLPLLRRASAHEADPVLARLLWWALGLKMVASLVQYAVVFDVYDGTADAAMYHQKGSEIARHVRDGAFGEIGEVTWEASGTAFIQTLTGFLYSVTGPTSIGGFLVYSWFGFWGLYLLHRAFVRACPEGDHRRYGRLVLLLPSLLFWPSSIGKEAWMCLGLGITAYGAARLLTHARGGLFALAGGTTMLFLVRPHVAVLALVATFAAYLLKRTPQGSSILAPIGKLAVTVLLGIGLVVGIGQMQAFLGVDRFDHDAVQITLEDVTDRTSEGGSQFSGRSTTDLNPSRFPEAFVNVMFRPFPWQVNNLQALVAATESLFLAGLFLVSWRRVAGSMRSVLHTPYVVLCCTYTVLFVYGFSAFSNAGILVRQRVQVLPFVLVLVCLPAVQRAADLWARPPSPFAPPDTLEHGQGSIGSGGP
jgi:hypothetical protein